MKIKLKYNVIVEDYYEGDDKPSLVTTNPKLAVQRAEQLKEKHAKDRSKRVYIEMTWRKHD